MKWNDELWPVESFDSIDWYVIDAEIAEQYPCSECGGHMHYESERTKNSYRAFSVCDDCGNREEF